MLTNEEKSYYIDDNNNVYDAETCKKKPSWTEKTWSEIQELISEHSEE